MTMELSGKPDWTSFPFKTSPNPQRNFEMNIFKNIFSALCSVCRAITMNGRDIARADRDDFKNL